jgi:hypothetical protein
MNMRGGNTAAAACHTATLALCVAGWHLRERSEGLVLVEEGEHLRPAHGLQRAGSEEHGEALKLHLESLENRRGQRSESEGHSVRLSSLLRCFILGFGGGEGIGVTSIPMDDDS